MVLHSLTNSNRRSRYICRLGCSYDYIRGLRSRSMHRASNFSNIVQDVINIIVTNRGGQSNRKKAHSRLFNSIRISLTRLRTAFSKWFASPQSARYNKQGFKTCVAQQGAASLTVTAKSL